MFRTALAVLLAGAWPLLAFCSPQPPSDLKYDGPVVYTDLPPPLLYFPNFPEKPKFENRGSSGNSEDKPIEYVPFPYQNLPLLVYQSGEQPPVHVVQKGQVESSGVKSGPAVYKVSSNSASSQSQPTAPKTATQTDQTYVKDTDVQDTETSESQQYISIGVSTLDGRPQILLQDPNAQYQTIPNDGQYQPQGDDLGAQHDYGAGISGSDIDISQYQQGSAGYIADDSGSGNEYDSTQYVGISVLPYGGVQAEQNQETVAPPQQQFYKIVLPQHSADSQPGSENSGYVPRYQENVQPQTPVQSPIIGVGQQNPNFQYVAIALSDLQNQHKSFQGLASQHFQPQVSSYQTVVPESPVATPSNDYRGQQQGYGDTSDVQYQQILIHIPNGLSQGANYDAQSEAPYTGTAQVGSFIDSQQNEGNYKVQNSQQYNTPRYPLKSSYVTAPYSGAQRQRERPQSFYGAKGFSGQYASGQKYHASSSRPSSQSQQVPPVSVHVYPSSGYSAQRPTNVRNNVRSNYKPLRPSYDRYSQSRDLPYRTPYSSGPIRPPRDNIRSVAPHRYVHSAPSDQTFAYSNPGHNERPPPDQSYGYSNPGHNERPPPDQSYGYSNQGNYDRPPQDQSQGYSNQGHNDKPIQPPSEPSSVHPNKMQNERPVKPPPPPRENFKQGSTFASSESQAEVQKSKKTPRNQSKPTESSMSVGGDGGNTKPKPPALKLPHEEISFDDINHFLNPNYNMFGMPPMDFGGNTVSPSVLPPNSFEANVQSFAYPQQFGEVPASIAAGYYGVNPYVQPPQYQSSLPYQAGLQYSIPMQYPGIPPFQSYEVQQPGRKKVRSYMMMRGRIPKRGKKKYRGLAGRLASLRHSLRTNSLRMKSQINREEVKEESEDATLMASPRGTFITLGSIKRSEATGAEGTNKNPPIIIYKGVKPPVEVYGDKKDIENITPPTKITTLLSSVVTESTLSTLPEVILTYRDRRTYDIPDFSLSKRSGVAKPDASNSWLPVDKPLYASADSMQETTPSTPVNETQTEMPKTNDMESSNAGDPSIRALERDVTELLTLLNEEEKSDLASA